MAMSGKDTGSSPPLHHSPAAAHTPAKDGFGKLSQFQKLASVFTELCKNAFTGDDVVRLRTFSVNAYTMGEAYGGFFIGVFSNTQ
jgi:hypothetical protein